MEVTEAPLETDIEMGVRAFPGAVTAEGEKLGEVVGLGELFENEVGEGGRGLSECKAGVYRTFDEEGFESESLQDECGETPSESGSDDGDIAGLELHA